jgi:hypothetical protein
MKVWIEWKGDPQILKNSLIGVYERIDQIKPSDNRSILAVELNSGKPHVVKKAKKFKVDNFVKNVKEGERPKPQSPRPEPPPLQLLGDSITRKFSDSEPPKKKRGRPKKMKSNADSE